MKEATPGLNMGLVSTISVVTIILIIAIVWGAQGWFMQMMHAEEQIKKIDTPHYLSMEHPDREQFDAGQLANLTAQAPTPLDEAKKLVIAERSR